VFVIGLVFVYYMVVSLVFGTSVLSPIDCLKRFVSKMSYVSSRTSTLSTDSVRQLMRLSSHSEHLDSCI